jgi:hypothetical protein
MAHRTSESGKRDWQSQEDIQMSIARFHSHCVNTEARKRRGDVWLSIPEIVYFKKMMAVQLDEHSTPLKWKVVR